MANSSEMVAGIVGACMFILGWGLIVVPHFVLYRHDNDRNSLHKGVFTFVGIGMACMSLPPLLIGVLSVLAPLLR